MDWMQVIVIVVAIGGINMSLIGWLRSDMKLFETEIRGWKEEINKQMTDFHGRLCTIEGKNHSKSKTDNK